MASFAGEQLPAGAIVKENGDVVYPATKRPDGTWRKERLIRKSADGKVFVPQEEQRAFETKASRVSCAAIARPIDRFLSLARAILPRLGRCSLARRRSLREWTRRWRSLRRQ